MLRAAILTGLLALLAATPACARTCAPRAHERVMARSEQAVALLADFKERQTLTGCSPKSGGRVVIGRVASSSGDDVRFTGVRLTGRHLGYLVLGTDHYNVMHLDLWVQDALTADDPGMVTFHPGHLTTFAIGPRGEAAWVADGHVIVGRRVPGGTDERTLDTGLVLTDLHFRGTTVTWNHWGAPRSADIGPTHNACVVSAVRGTLDADLITINGSQRAVCWRPNGVVTTVNPYDIAGPYAVGLDSGRFALYDLRTGTAMTVGTAERFTTAVVDRYGSVAWEAVSTSGPGRDIWVRDALGTHAVATADPWSRPLRRDDSTIWWTATDHYNLVPAD
jgi:hypothetical protein